MTQSETQDKENRPSQQETKTVKHPQNPDPFYCDKNQRHLEKVVADLNARRHVSRHDLSED